MGGFVHLHGHSTYSLLDGACRIPQLVQRAADQGCPALAVTDHGNLFGAIEFYKAARKRGVKPILGFEAYVAPLSRFDRERNPVAAWHLTLLARNNAGWHNLIKLSSAGYLEGFYYVPRIDRELLTRHSEGLVVLSGCLSSETSYWLRRGETVKAREAAAFYHDLFGEHYYLEIQRHGIEDEEKCLEGCIDLARHFGRPLVATNDYHYEEKADADAQELLVCINTGKTLTDKNRMRMSSQELYFKTPEEMGALFRELPESLHSTLEIAEKCNVEFTFGKTHLPAFEVPAGRSTEAYFREVCEQGLRKRYGAEPAPEVWERFEYEFDVIQRMGFTSYFLIVWDFIRYARENGIPVGPGRGSAAGSVLAYALEIVDVDPLRYDLLFERFLNEERISLPDIDIDFCRDGREKVIEYVQKKYGGKERVAQIITFGRMAAKAVIRDVGRVLGVPLPEVDRIAKRIPAGPGVTLRSALEQDAELREIAADPESEGGRLFDFALRLEGCHRNASTHAAGVVIADAPLTEYLPLYKSGEDVSTQFTMDTVEELGLLKMDFLGLKTLTLIDYARKLVEERGGTLPDFRSKEFTRFEDPKTYELLSRGESFGVFQLESAGMRDLLRRLKPRSFEESLVLIALFRPGPLDSGMTDVYCNRKNGIEPVDYDHPTLESTLKETYGVIVYQEQVMLIAHEVAGLTLNQADNLRKAMGKKKPELMEPYKQPFLVGCGKSGVPRETALRIWDKMATFARYGFNKSHATAYAAITYQTAWLKANHPREFMAALLTVDSGNMDKVSEALEECRRLEIPVLPPDVSRSGPDFRVEQDAIRFGLTSVKGVGGQAAEKIVEAAREGAFRALYDLTARVDTRVVNKSTVEALVKAGACDSLGGHRAQLHAAVDGALRSAAVEQADRRAGQMNLLSGAAVDAEPVAPLPDVPSWTDDEILRWERETTGRYWSSHPLAEHEDLLRTFASRTTRTVQECREGAPVVLGGLLVGLQERTIRSGRNEGKRMVRFRIEDFHGSVEAVMFSEAFQRHRDQIEENRVLFFRGDVDASREEVCVRVNEVFEPEAAPRALAGLVLLHLDRTDADHLRAVRESLERHSGDRPVLLSVEPQKGLRVLMRADAAFGVDPSPAFVQELRDLVGPERIQLMPPPGGPTARKRNAYRRSSKPQA